MIPKISYKSKLATLISYLGTIAAVIGAICVAGSNRLQEVNSQKAELIGGIGGVCLIGGLITIGVVFLVMKKRSYEKLIQYVKDNNLEHVIADSVDDAVKLYKACPGVKMEKYIAGLNPEAGQFIKKNRGRLR